MLVYHCVEIAKLKEKTSCADLSSHRITARLAEVPK
jgi:hypothetical protein